MPSIRWDPISTHLRGLWKDSGESGTQRSAQSLACRKCSQCTGHHDSFTPTGTHGQPEQFGLGPASASGNTGLFYMLPSPLHVKVPGPASSVLDVQHQGRRGKTGRAGWCGSAPRTGHLGGREVLLSTKDRGQLDAEGSEHRGFGLQHQGQRAAGRRGKRAQGLWSSAPRTVDS